MRTVGAAVSLVVHLSQLAVVMVCQLAHKHLKCLGGALVCMRLPLRGFARAHGNTVMWQDCRVFIIPQAC